MLLWSQAHGNNIDFAAELEVGRKVKSKGGIAVRTTAQLMTVQPDDRIRHCAVESDGEIAALRILGQEKRLAVPPRAGDGQRSGVRVELRIERAFNRPVVGQA